jgi:hypothetical protein
VGQRFESSKARKKPNPTGLGFYFVKFIDYILHWNIYKGEDSIFIRINVYFFKSSIIRMIQLSILGFIAKVSLVIHNLKGLRDY